MSWVHVCEEMTCLRVFKREFSGERDRSSRLRLEGTADSRVQEDLRHIIILNAVRRLERFHGSFPTLESFTFCFSILKKASAISLCCVCGFRAQ